jgi:hypothetical protein
MMLGLTAEVAQAPSREVNDARPTYWVKLGRDLYQLKGSNLPYYSGAGG